MTVYDFYFRGVLVATFTEQHASLASSYAIQHPGYKCVVTSF